MCCNKKRTHHQKESAFDEEPSSDNDEVAALDLIPPQNGAGTFNGIGGYTFDYAKEGVLVGKIDLESMLEESGSGGATEMGGSTMDKSP